MNAVLAVLFVAVTTFFLSDSAHAFRSCDSEKYRYESAIREIDAAKSAYYSSMSDSAYSTYREILRNGVDIENAYNACISERNAQIENASLTFKR